MRGVGNGDVGKGKEKEPFTKLAFLERALLLRHPVLQMLPRIERRRILSALFLAVLGFVACTVSIGVIALQGARFPPALEPSDKYTVLINTWKRPDLLVRCVTHYAKCANLDHLRIIWSESPFPPDELKATILKSMGSYSKNVGVVYDIRKENSLNTRMEPIPDLRTDVVFSVDDDVIVPCRSLELAFNVWRSSPNAMVGFVPRTHLLLESSKGPGGLGGKVTYGYGGWWYVWWHGGYSMILSKASFFHKKYFSAYTHDMPKEIRDYVSRNRNCEDIAMSMLVANATSAPPVWVQGRFQDFGGTGISSKKLHWERRSNCLNDFVSMWGFMPLITGYAKVTDGRHQLWW